MNTLREELARLNDDVYIFFFFFNFISIFVQYISMMLMKYPLCLVALVAGFLPPRHTLYVSFYSLNRY